MHIYTDGYYRYKKNENAEYRIERYCDGCGLKFTHAFYPLEVLGALNDQVVFCEACIAKLKVVNV